MYSSRSPCSRSLLRSPADASLGAEDDPLTQTSLHHHLREDISQGSRGSSRGDEGIIQNKIQ